MEKRDHKKIWKEFYSASVQSPKIIEIPDRNYLCVEGSGRPDREEYQNAVKTLYPAAYLIKFALRKRLEIDFRVMPLETKWDLKRKNGRTTGFFWTAMIIQPDDVSELDYDSIQSELQRNKPPYLERLKFCTIKGGLQAQILHKGPYRDMNKTLHRVLTELKERELNPEIDTHDIYLNSILKTKPENLKTIMRVRLI